MKAEVRVQVGEKVVRLAMPIGGLEQLAQHEGVPEHPVELLQSFILGLWKPKEVRLVIAVGCEWGSGELPSVLESSLSPGELRRVATELMTKALKDDSGNFGAAAFQYLTDSDSSSASTS